MKILFASDLHLGHRNIIKYSKRPFDSVEEMDEALISNWNNAVSKDDVVYYLGDLCLGGSERAIHYLKQLNGSIKFVKGNHDWKWLQDKDDVIPYLDSINKLIMMRMPVQQEPLIHKSFTLSHYPLKTNEFQTDYLIYGHIHNNEPDPYWDYQKSIPNVLNACIDVNDYKPVTFDELIANNRKIKNEGVL